MLLIYVIRGYTLSDLNLYTSYDAKLFRLNHDYRGSLAIYTRLFRPAEGDSTS